MRTSANKCFSFFFLVGIVLIGCQQATSIPTLTPVLTNESQLAQPTAIAVQTVARQPTLTLTAPPHVTETSTPTNVPDVSASPTPVSCLTSVPAEAVYPDVVTHVLYQKGNEFWRWDTSTHSAEILFSLPDAAENAVLSTDRQLLAYTRVIGENEREVWVMDMASQEEKLLDRVTAVSVLTDYPDAASIQFGLSWLGDLHILNYGFQPVYDGIGGGPLPPLNWVNADSGEILQTDDPALAENRTMPPADLSPNGRYAIIRLYGDTMELQDTVQDTVQEINLPFTILDIGLGEYSSPGAATSNWISNTERYIAVSNVTNTGNNEVFDDKATFTVWLMNVETMAFTELETYTGFFFSLVFAPNGRYLAYYLQPNRSNQRDLFLVNLENGEQIKYLDGRLIGTSYTFDSLWWSPDSTRFAYRVGNQTGLFIGHICAAPIHYPEMDVTYGVQWLDTHNILNVFGSWETDQWELRQYTTTGEIYVIDRFASGFPYYVVYADA